MTPKDDDETNSPEAIALGDMLDRLHHAIIKLVAERDVYRARCRAAAQQMDEMTLRLQDLTARRKEPKT